VGLKVRGRRPTSVLPSERARQSPVLLPPRAKTPASRSMSIPTSTRGPSGGGKLEEKPVEGASRYKLPLPFPPELLPPLGRPPPLPPALSPPLARPPEVFRWSVHRHPRTRRSTHRLDGIRRAKRHTISRWTACRPPHSRRPVAARLSVGEARYAHVDSVDARGLHDGDIKGLRIGTPKGGVCGLAERGDASERCSFL
jgi:hypothetical protein